MSNLNLVFFGSDEFSLAALHACFDSGHSLKHIVTTPAQKKGRGLRLTPNVVQILAEEQELPFMAPPDLKDKETIESVKALRPDVFVVSSYGKYIPSAWLEIPALASLNVHPSILPKYRGSGPIQWAILNGDPETGVSIIEVAKKLDAGDIFAQEKTPIAPHEDYPALSQRLADLSYEILIDILQGLPKTLNRKPQDENEATYARKLTKEDALVNFSEPAAILDRKIRGLKPWPGCHVMFEGNRLLLLEAEIPPHDPAMLPAVKPGSLLDTQRNGSMDIQTGEGILRVKAVQPAGKKAMPAADFIRGRRLEIGFVFDA